MTMAGPFEITLPSGVVYPDWSCVTAPKARAALNAVLRIEGSRRRWSGLSDEADRVRRAVIEAYRTTGRAPSLEGLGTATGFDGETLRAQLEDLAGRDIVVAGPEGEAIAGAYPFVEHSRGHHLRIAGVEINAMCAIDALGAGAMCGADAVIDSTCAQCSAAIHLETRDHGAVLAVVEPRGAVVRVGTAYADNCCAHSLCRVMTYFCSNEHLQMWCAANDAQGEDYRLSMDEALQTGRALFAPLLKENST